MVDDGLDEGGHLGRGGGVEKILEEAAAAADLRLDHGQQRLPLVEEGGQLPLVDVLAAAAARRGEAVGDAGAAAGSGGEGGERSS